MATPRNEYGLTAYQQKRYNKITVNMLKVQERLNPEEHISLNLQDQVSISSLLERIERSKEKLTSLEKAIKDFEEFNGRENEIVISKQEANQLSLDWHDIEYSGLGNTLRFLYDHAEKIEKLEEIRKTQEEKPDFKTEVLKDMLALENEFESVKFNIRSGHVYCTTGDVILRDEHGNPINLGKFKLSYKTGEVRLNVKAMAIDPVWHQTSRNFHPHVQNNGDICLGEAQSILGGAHKRGDIYTIFMTLKSLIETYNPGSPYARLETWVGTPCDHCGVNGSTERRRICLICGDSVCINCFTQIDYPRYRTEYIGYQYICSTCQTEERHKCPGVNGEECSQYIDGRIHRFCGSCQREAERQGLDLTPGNVQTQENNIETISDIHRARLEVLSPGTTISNTSQNVSGVENTNNPFDVLVNTVRAMETERTRSTTESGSVSSTRHDNEVRTVTQACASCNRSFTPNEETVICTDCDRPICPDCARATRCEDCGEHVCAGCRIPCSRCRIPVHIDCTTEDENRNMLCSTCASVEQPVPVPLESPSDEEDSTEEEIPQSVPVTTEPTQEDISNAVESFSVVYNADRNREESESSDDDDDDNWWDNDVPF